MSVEQKETETKINKKRPLEESNDNDTKEPSPKRRKICPQNNEKENKNTNTNAIKQPKPTTPPIKPTLKQPTNDEKKQEEPIKQPKSPSKNTIPSEIKQLIPSFLKKNKKIKNDSEIKNIRFLENERILIYKLENKLFENGKYILSIEYTNKNQIFESIIIINDKNEITNIEIEDQIMMDQISISQGIEYTFDGIVWYIGSITYDSLEYYKKSKFLDWKKQISKPSCEAAFKRLLCIGLITNIFDRYVFKSPDNEINDYKVKDDNGKIVDIPRPVKELRKWNVEKKEYENISPHLNGAPDKENAKKYWDDMVDGFKKEHGEEYIDNLMASFNKNKNDIK